MCGGGEDKKDEGHTPATPALSPTVEAMIAALTKGPAGYSPAMRQNLGMDVKIPGFQGGRPPVSGMTQGAGPFGYTPVAPAKIDPLAPMVKPGAGTKGSVSEADLFLQRKLPRPKPTPQTPTPQSPAPGTPGTPPHQVGMGFGPY
jgi:hypothetical protein